MQTSNNFTTRFFEGFNTIKANEGWNGLYKGLGPLWMRQVPYTMVKFGAFENIVRSFYRNVFTAPKESYSKATQLSIVFMSGYLAGIFCAIVSHPADTMVSILNKKSSNAPIGQQVKEIYGDIGFKGLWNGIGARIIMVGTLTGLQWWIYDSFKVAVGLQASGGKWAPLFCKELTTVTCCSHFKLSLSNYYLNKKAYFQTYLLINLYCFPY